MPGKKSKGAKKEPQPKKEENHPEPLVNLGRQESADDRDDAVTTSHVYESSFLVFIMQVKILLWKNATIFFRKKKILFFMFATPFLVCAMLNYIADIANELNDKGKVDQKEWGVTTRGLKKCYGPPSLQWGVSNDCSVVSYSILGKQTEDSEKKQGQRTRIHGLMNEVAQSNNFEVGNDKEIRYIPHETPADVTQMFKKHPNETTFHITFCLDTWKDTIKQDITSGGKKKGNNTEELGVSKGTDIEFPCTFDQVEDQDMFFYSMMYNISHLDSSFLKGFKKPLPRYIDLLRLKM
jgi:hypothetical protein